MNNTVEELKEVLDFGFSLQEQISKANEDGKVNWKDLPKAVKVLGKIGPAIDGTVDAVKDYQNLTEEQRAELFHFVEERLDLADDELEALIEDTITEVQQLIDLSRRWANYAKKEKA